MSALGRQLFFDASLSASGRQSCATCHDPNFAYGPPNARAVQVGGARLNREGVRAVPSLRYLEQVPTFNVQYFDEDFDESIDNGPTGGLTWDGRALNPHTQARIPLLSEVEMANRNEAAVVKAVRHSAYADEFREAFGEHVLESVPKAFAAITQALEVFLDDPKEFFPYDSKFDAVLRHQAQFTAQERRGLDLYDDPAKGNCAHCHPSRIGESGNFPAFTDFGYAALAVPRNSALSSNKNPRYFDLGLCGPYRKDLKDRADLCGMFRAPSLRNVALRHSFFHNGQFHDLRTVLQFYNERDIHPERWYPKSGAGQSEYDDLPKRYFELVDKEPPFDRKRGDTPAMTDADIDDILAFLNTLTDGWTAPVAQR